MRKGLISVIKKCFQVLFATDQQWPFAVDWFRRSLAVGLVSVTLVYPTLLVISALTERYVDLSILDPAENKDHNFDMLDLVQRVQRSEDGPLDDRIVIVNIGSIGRSEIARTAEELLRARPSVLGIDIDLAHPSSGVDTSGTGALLGMLQKNTNVVMGYDVNNMAHIDASRKGMPGQWGYVNLRVSDSLETVRFFTPVFNASGDPRYPDHHYSFAAQVAKRYSIDRWLDYSPEPTERNAAGELILYRRTEDPAGAFVVEGFADMIRTDTARIQEQLAGKIVILADRSICPTSDLHYTPLNSIMSGRAFPDMQGSELHARWVSNILTGRKLRGPAFPWIVLLLLVTAFVASIPIILTHIWMKDSFHAHIGRLILDFLSRIALSVLVIWLASLWLSRGIALPVATMLVLVWLTGTSLELLEQANEQWKGKTDTTPTS